MPSDLEVKLRAEFPTLFAEMRMALRCRDGWYQVIRGLCLELYEIEKATGLRISIMQMKEKFAELRVYLHQIDGSGIHEGLDDGVWREITYNLIKNATEYSRHVCDICGKPGEIRTITRETSSRNWTLCTEHYEEERNRQL